MLAAIIPQVTDELGTQNSEKSDKLHVIPYPFMSFSSSCRPTPGFVTCLGTISTACLLPSFLKSQMSWTHRTLRSLTNCQPMRRQPRQGHGERYCALGMGILPAEYGLVDLLSGEVLCFLHCVVMFLAVHYGRLTCCQPILPPPQQGHGERYGALGLGILALSKGCVEKISSEF